MFNVLRICKYAISSTESPNAAVSLGSEGNVIELVAFHSTSGDP